MPGPPRASNHSYTSVACEVAENEVVHLENGLFASQAQDRMGNICKTSEGLVTFRTARLEQTSSECCPERNTPVNGQLIS